MTPNTFQREMDRLSDTFGAYKRERMQLIWLEVKDMPDDWFRGLCSEFIGEERQAPLLDRFREEVSKFRESSWKEQKEVYKQEAKEWASRFSNEDVHMICDTIAKRVNGAISDADWQSFLKLINISVIDSKFNSCNYCSESGIIWQKEGGYEYVYRCTCDHGNRHKTLKQMTRLKREI